jgi:imidazolonepropionase
VQAGAASVDHLEWIGTEDIELLARSQTVAALVPGAMFHVRSGRYAPARALIDAGAAVALATDFSTFHCPSSSMAAIISLACAEMQMTPAEAITAATINGAHALRCASRLGSIESGKEADLILLNASDFREIPYHFGMNLVAMVMKRGEVLFPRAGF